MQPEQLQHSFCFRGERFEFLVRFFRRNDFHQFDFVELMYANDATRIAPGGTGFASETRRVGGEFLRKIANAQDLLAMEICN